MKSPKVRHANSSFSVAKKKYIQYVYVGLRGFKKKKNYGEKSFEKIHVHCNYAYISL